MYIAHEHAVHHVNYISREQQYDQHETCPFRFDKQFDYIVNVEEKEKEK
jgi:hypothetical protein